MAVTIEVSRGRYLRHLREQAGYNQRALIDAANDLLPVGALRQLVGADLDELGVKTDEVARYQRLFSTLDDPPGQPKNRSRGQPKSSFRRMTQSRVACPNLAVPLLPSTAAKWRGGPRAYCS